MRLIDADALLKAIIGYPYGYRGMTESEIENQQTVDAVPVKVIQKRIDDLMKILSNIDDSKTDYILQLSIKIETLQELLAMWAWRKTDETD